MTWSELQAEPAFGFTVIGLIIVFGPLVAERLRLPGLLGLLVFGAVVGPNVLDLFPTFSTLRAIGDIGVLYLIFLSGLQLDLDSFAKNWRISAGFGGLTSVFPMVLGTLAALAAGIDLTASILIGSFWASFTLIAYPVIVRYGLTRNRAVSAIVGASSITDTVSLVVLAIIVGAETGDAGGVQLLVELALGFAVLVGYCLFVVPFVARWFFTGLGQERALRFVLVLVAMTSSAVVADLMGVEALIGAFFAGVGLNRIVPNASPLMSVTEFYGNAFFIPTFLVSVGLLFDPQLMVQWSTIRLALLFGLALVAGKAIAAVISGRLFRLEAAEVGLMFSVSVAQAAATLAATIVGLGAGLYGDNVVNAVMVVVSLSLVITSVGAERFAPRVHPPTGDTRALGEAILVPVEREPSAVTTNFKFAARLAESSGGVLQPLVVVTTTSAGDIDAGRQRCAETDRVLRRLGLDVESVLRVDRSVATGIHRASIESSSSMLLLPWPRPEGIRSWLLGASYQEVIGASSIPTAVAAIHDEPFERIVILARRPDLLPGRVTTLSMAAALAEQLRERDHLVGIGPLDLESIATAGVVLPEETVELAPGDADSSSWLRTVARVGDLTPGDADSSSWLRTVTRAGDLVIAPIDTAISSTLVALHEDGRSVLAVSDSRGGEPFRGGSTLAFGVGSSIGPT